MYRQAKTILLEMGHLFQVKDDYLDCYGSIEDIGKSGTDIAEGKCSWLIVVALQRATPEQKKIFEVYMSLIIFYIHYLFLSKDMNNIQILYRSAMDNLM